MSRRLRRCAACQERRPSEWFPTPKTSRGGRKAFVDSDDLDRCKDCRSESRTYTKKTASTPPAIPLSERLAIYRARKERKAFEERGAPRIERPYLRLPAGGIAFALAGAKRQPLASKLGLV
jgi:hypothetical protein